MINKIFKNQKGLTFIELMVAIAIIGIISAIFVFYIKGTDRERVEMVTEQIAADAKYVRNLATSRTTYDFGDGNGPVFPPGGYGIEFNDFDNGNPAEYFVFVDKAIDGDDLGAYKADYDPLIDGLIKHVILDDADLRLDDTSGTKTYFYFTFLEENKVATNMTSYTVDNGKYNMAILDPGPGYPAKGYKGIISLGESSAEVSEAPLDYQYIWGNIGFYYAVYNPPAPPTPGPTTKYDPAISLPGGE